MSKSDEKRELIKLAQERFEAAQKWESAARARFMEDFKFANGDSRNNYQWPQEILQYRTTEQKPIVTVNKTRQHNLNIVNDLRKNRPAVSYKAKGGGASVKSAEMLQALARHIEGQSNADIAYDNASNYQVTSGVGYLRVEIDYKDENSFDREIFIRPVHDSLTVLLDDNHRLPDGSDAKWGFVFEDIAREEFNKRYPKFKDKGTSDIFGTTAWLNTDNVRICEYFYLEMTDDWLFEINEETGETILASSIGNAELVASLKADGSARRRRVERPVWWRAIIVGHEVIEDEIIPGRYIPIVKVVGEEFIVENKLDRRGHTRSLIDAQRMYNYWSSSSIEYGSLQTKVPWILPLDAVEGLEWYWQSANTVNHAYLPYKHRDEEGLALPAPQKTPPPIAAPVALSGMEVAAREMEFVSGQYGAAMGQPGNERTGKAIGLRQEAGDRSTYHFTSNQSFSVRQVGRIILDLIPKVYNSRRVIEVLAEDETPLSLTLDPNAEESYQEELDENQQIIARILNPKLGNYDVNVKAGQSYGSQREAAFDAISLILTQSPGLTSIVGDLMFKAADFPYADEMAKRLRNMVDPAALGEGPTPNEQKLQSVVDNLQKFIDELMQDNAALKLKVQSREDKRSIDVYKAQTDRFGMLADAADADSKISKELVDDLARDTFLESKTTNINEIYEEHARTRADRRAAVAPQQLEMPFQSTGEPQQ